MKSFVMDIIKAFSKKIHSDFDANKVKLISAFVVYEYEGKRINVRVSEDNWSIERV